MTAQIGMPLRPDPAALRQAEMASLTRAAIAVGLARLDNHRPADVAKERWADDRSVGPILQAARLATRTIPSTHTKNHRSHQVPLPGYGYGPYYRY